MEVKQVNFNWFTSPENGEEFSTISCGDYATYYDRLSENKCVQINEHMAVGEGDKWYYDAIYEDGKVIRIFNPNQVFYF